MFGKYRQNFVLALGVMVAIGVTSTAVVSAGADEVGRPENSLDVRFGNYVLHLPSNCDVALIEAEPDENGLFYSKRGPTVGKCGMTDGDPSPLEEMLAGEEQYRIIRIRFKNGRGYSRISETGIYSANPNWLVPDPPTWTHGDTSSGKNLIPADVNMFGHNISVNCILDGLPVGSTPQSDACTLTGYYEPASGERAGLGFRVTFFTGADLKGRWVDFDQAPGGWTEPILELEKAISAVISPIN